MKLLDLTPCDPPRAEALPATVELLTSGGDPRIAIDSAGLNRYGCRPTPDPNLLAFGSSTASTISQAGFLAADRLRNQLQSDCTTSPHALYARELDRLRAELCTLCGIDEDLRPDMIFAASGTDLHLIAAGLACRNGTWPLDVIIAGADETGRGVPMAVTGRHFSSTSALGAAVADGHACLDGIDIRLHTVPVRSADGTPRSMADVDHDVETLAHLAIAARHQVLLIVVDVSKTGMIAPSPDCAMALRKRFPDSVDLMVDACQFRMAPATLRSYLEHGFMLALTGSKFLTGPTFSGLLMIPQCAAQVLRRHPLPNGLAAYTCNADWPSDWTAADVLGRGTNFGLLLRWEAALAELRRFAVIPERRVADILSRFGNAVTSRLFDDARFEPLSSPRLDRAAVTAEAQWDKVQTIFPFIACRIDRDGTRHRLTRSDTLRLYQRLQSRHDNSSSTSACSTALELGQPVPCGTSHGVELSALRLCMSARLAADAAVPGNEEAVINQAMHVLDEVARLAADMY